MGRGMEVFLLCRASVSPSIKQGYCHPLSSSVGSAGQKGASEFAMRQLENLETQTSGKLNLVGSQTFMQGTLKYPNSAL